MSWSDSKSASSWGCSSKLRWLTPDGVWRGLATAGSMAGFWQIPVPEKESRFGLSEAFEGDPLLAGRVDHRSLIGAAWQADDHV